MDSKKYSKIVYGGLFAILLFLSFKIELFQIVGSNKAFTLHNLIAPVSLYFLNPIIAVSLVLIEKGISDFSLISLIFTLPTIWSMFVFKYVERYKYIGVIAPILGMLLFLIHPEVGFGKTPYFLIWIIPIVASLKQNLFLRSLTTTFNAHVVGSIAFLYLVNPLSPIIWSGLMAIVLIERAVFASGIGVSYILFNHLSKLSNKAINNLISKQRVEA